jgi:tetratricopeptide (TPR) repeat protein
MVTVVGEAGIGKSRLLTELEGPLAAEHPDAVVLRGRADPPRELVPYGLMRDVWFQYFDIAEHAAGPEALARLEAGFGELLGSRTHERAHLVGHLIGLDVRSSVHLAGILADPRQVRDRAFAAATELVTAMGRGAGVVMLLEDLHWSDQGSLDMIEHLVRACAMEPLGVVASTRPALYEKRPAWALEIPDAVRLDLTPLPDTAATTLVGYLLSRVGDLPDSVRATIVETADGNPYYVEEIVQSLIEDEAIDTSGAEWRFTTDRLDDLRVPTTLTSLLQARLDRLPVGERTVLQQASVVGRTFWDQAVLSTRDGSPFPERTGADVAADLAALEDKRLVFEHALSNFAGAREFTFKHALLRDVAYESLLRPFRRHYHRAVAAWLAAQPDADSRAATIARHYELAEASAESCRWYVAAATQARDRYANDDAVRYYRRSLDTGELELNLRLAALDGLAEVLMLQAQYDQALEAGRAMQAAAVAAGDPKAQARALAGISFVQSRRGANDDALASAMDAVRLLRGSPGARPEDLADALLPAGWAALRLGDLTAALRSADEARQLALRSSDRRTVARALNLRSLVESALGDHGAASAHLEEGLAIDRERGDRRAEGASLINLGEHARMRGDFAQAVARYVEALSIQRELGDHDMEALSMSNLGGAHVGLGDYAAALGYLLPALDAFGRSGAAESLSETYRFLAEARLGLGDAHAAVADAWQALQTATEANNPEQTGHAWRTLGIVAARGGRRVPLPGGDGTLDAGECFARSAAVFADAGLERERAMTLADWATWERAHDVPQAERRFAEAREELERLGLDLIVGRAVAAFEQTAPGPT